MANNRRDDRLEWSRQILAQEQATGKTLVKDPITPVISQKRASSTTGDRREDRMNWAIQQMDQQAGTDINSWITSSNSLLSQYGGLANNWRAKDDAAYDAFNERKSRLLSYAQNYRQMYQGNDDAINAINSVVNALSDTDLRGIRNYWSQWDSAEQYNTAKHNYDLYQKYNPYTQEQIDAELAGMDQQNPDRAWLEDYSRQKKYLDLDKNADFAANSQYESTKKGDARIIPSWDGGAFVTDTGYDDILYDYINRNQDAIDTQNINDINSYATRLGVDKGHLQQMTDDQIARFNYLYKTQSSDAAYEYIKSIEPGLNALNRQKEMAYWEEYAGKHPVISSGLSFVTNLDTTLSFLGQVGDYLEDGKIDQNAGYNRSVYITNTIRGAADKVIQEKWGPVGSFLYQNAMSIGDQVLRTFLSGGYGTGLSKNVVEQLTLLTMASGASASMVVNAKDRGLDETQTIALGVIAGAAEYISEKIGFDALFNANLRADSVKKYLLKNMASEGLEEFVSGVANLVADLSISGDRAEVRIRAEEIARERGISIDEAFGIALGEQALEIGKDMLGGAFSGGLMAGVSSYFGYHSSVDQTADVDNLIRQSLEINPDNQMAKDIQAKFDAKQKVTPVDIDRLQGQYETDYQNAVNNDRELISNAAATRLSDLGETGDVNAIAQAIGKYIQNRSESRMAARNPSQTNFRSSGLTGAERQLILNSRYGQQVLNELNTNSLIQANEQDRRWTGEIGTRMINPQMYSRFIQNTQTEQTAPAAEQQTAAPISPDAWMEQQQRTQNGQQSVPNAAPATNVGTNVSTETTGTTESVAMAGREMPRNTSVRFQNVMPATRMTQANKAVPAAVNDVASEYGNQAAAIRSIYNMGTNKNLTVIAPAIRAAYEIGLNGGLESAAMNASSTRALTPAQRSLAYRVGVAAANNAPKRGNASRKGTVHSDNFKIGGNKYRRMIYNAVNFLAEESGITIEMNDSRGKSVVQGGFNKDTDVLTLDISADINTEEDARKAIKYAALRTFSHELTHFGQKWSSQDYNALTATVLEVMADRYGDEFIEDRIRYWQDRYKNEAGQILSTADAIDEIVAESMTEVLPESQFFEKLIQRSQPTASRLIDALKNFIARLRQYFRNLDTNIRPEVNALMAETEDGTLKYMEGIVEQWDRMMLNAVENYNRAQAEEEAAPATAKAEDIDQKGIQSVQDQNGHEMFNLRTMKQDVDYYMQDLRDAGLVGEGKALSETDLDYLYTSINRVMNYVERNIDAIERKESFREMDGTNRPFLPYKSNSDPHYKMALDYSTLCRKRLLTQAITERLQASLKRALTPVEQVRIRNEIKKLQAEGKKVDVACALCYVEAARLKSPKVINEFLNNKEAALKNYFSLANTRFKNEVYAKRQGDWKESRGLSRTATKDEIKAKGFSVQEFNRFSVQIREQYWDWLRENDPEAYARERAIVDLAESTDNQEFLRADSLARMRRETPELYDAFITKVRQATRSKAQETDVPYARGDINSVSDALIEQMNNESGFRHQSWSDFQAMHLLDTVASIIELSTRKAKVHTYTKVADMVRLLGMTNMAINMSLIPAGETGLSEDGSLAFDPVEGIDYDTMVDLRKEFHKTAGNIAIGITDDQIRALMASPVIDYIIPYHTSGLNKDMRKRMGIRAWKDYTKYQNEVGSGAKPELHEWFNEQEAMAAADGVAYMVEASRKYLQLCHERGLVPKFPQFLQKNADGSYSLAEDAQNYWKLLIDRKMVDQYDNSVIIQQAVVPKFDVDVMLDILSNEVNSQAAIDAREAEDIIVQKMLDPDRSPFTKAELEQARAVRDAALRFAIDDMREEVDATAQEIENNEYAEEAVQHSLRVTEPAVLNRLNAEMEKGEYDPVTNPDGGYITVYRTYQVIDGGLYPPMNAVDRDENGRNRQLGFRSEPGVWEMATEAPEIARAYLEKHPEAQYAKFDLDGVDNKTGGVDYAPYLHSSNMVLNDQFSAAYRRNLVVVECRVPVSEMNGAYRAQYAKNGTGWHEWKKGRIAGALAKQKPEYSREVFLSRYMMPVRQLTDAEVANMYKEYLDGTNLSIPWNVVTPGLRQALEDAGVPIDYSDVKIGTKTYSFADTQSATQNEQYSIRGNGYDGYSMSNNARAAYADGEMPISKWTKQDIVFAVGNINPDIDISSLNLNTLRDKFLTRTSWHHTSMYYNATDFYSINEDYVAGMTQKDVDAIAQNQTTTTKQKRDASYDDSVDDAYRKVLTIVESGMLKTENGAISKLIKGKSFDEAYRKAAEIIRSRDASRVERWRQLPEGHWRKEYVDLYDNNFDEYITKMYADKKLSRNSNTFKTLADYFRKQQVPAESNNIQASLRTQAYTDRQLLEMAANDVSIMGGLTQADRSALEIFKSRLDKLRGFEEQQAEQRRILQELQAAAKPDRDEITKTQNRINLLGRKISAAENLVLDVENKQTLKKVLQHARNLAGNQVRRNERARLQERSDVMKYRERVQAKAKRLSDMILKNSDKEHVPAALRGPLADFVGSIGFDSRRKMSGGPDTKRDIKYTEALDRLRQIVQNQADYMANPENGSSLDYYLDLPEDFSLLIQEHLNQVTAAVKAFGAEDNNQVFAMDSNELKRLDQILTIINHSVSTINKKFVEGRFARIDQAGQNTILDMNERKAFNRSKRAAAISGFFEWKNALPYYAFKKYGEAGQEIFNGIQRGWEKFAFNTHDVIDFAENAYETEEQQAWSNELHKIELEDGRTVQMTTAQIMSLYCLNKREQARGHILGGGVRVGNIEAKQGRRKQTVTQTEPFNMTPDDVKAITDTLTDRQREVADALQEYMNTVGTKWGNEVSMARFGYDGFGEKNYFPIESDQTNLPAKDPDAKANDLFRLLNMSMTKALTPKANNALVVSDIFQVFANHMSDMAKYNALALPVLDAMKWINYKESTDKNENGQFKTLTVQRAIEEAYGQEGMSYFMNFMKDLNGKSNGGRDENGLLARGMSAYKVAAVAANLRVALLQPTAYFRASAVLKPNDMARAVTMNRRQAREERMKYSGISVWKDLGFYDTNIGRNVEDLIMHNETIRDKITDKALWLAEKGDAVTWDVIWNACKLDQQKKGLNGEELMKATADRFMEVIYRTQVVDSTLTRTQLMRDKSIAIKNITGFMSEPSVSYNLLLDAYEEFNTVAQREGKAQAWKATKGTILTAMGAYAASQLVAAIVESIADAARDDDDYESYLDKWLQAFLGDESFLKGNLYSDMSISAKVPLLKMIPSYLQGYETTDMVTQGLKDLFELPNFLKSQSRPDYGKIYKVAQVASRLGGVPIGNAMREFATIWNNTVGVITGQKLKTYTPNDKTVVKEAYEGGKLTEQKAIDELVRRAGMEEKDAKAQVTKWKYSEWDTNGGGLSQEEVAIGLESGNFTEKEKQQIWQDMGYKTDLSKKQESAKAIVAMDDKARVYNSSNWKDGLQDSSLSNSDKDRLVTAYGSDYFAKPYTSLRSAGYSPAEALRLLTAIDTDGNGSVKQAEAYAYLQGKSDQQALSIWNSFGWKTDWQTYKARQH